MCVGGQTGSCACDASFHLRPATPHAPMGPDREPTLLYSRMLACRYKAQKELDTAIYPCYYGCDNTDREFTQVNAEHPLITEARSWLLDCFEHVDGAAETIRHMTPTQIIRTVNKHFSGGWNAFVDCSYWAYERWYSKRD